MTYKIRLKAKRNEQLIVYRKANPELTLAEIGEAFGISRQRVHQILKENNGKKRVDR